MSSSAGPSKNMSIEEEAREKNKSFWEVNPELEDTEAAELAHAGNADFQLEMYNVEDTSGDGDATTTDRATTQISVVKTTQMSGMVVTCLLRSLRSRGRTGHRKRSATSPTRSQIGRASCRERVLRLV